MSAEPPRAVDFHFDIMCPYAYQTSLWMREVRDLTGIDVALAVLQPRGDQPGRGQEAPLGAGVVLRLVDDADRRLSAAPGHGAARPVVRRRRSGPPRRGPQAPPPRGGRGNSWPRWASTRPSCGRPSTIPPPATRSWPSTSVVTGMGGFGVPTLVFDDGQALFGPVLVNPPDRRRQALRLWDHVTGWLEFPHVYELQRPKSCGRHRRHRHRLLVLPRGPRLVLGAEPHALRPRPGHSGYGSTTSRRPSGSSSTSLDCSTSSARSASSAPRPGPGRRRRPPRGPHQCRGPKRTAASPRASRPPPGRRH